MGFPIIEHTIFKPSGKRATENLKSGDTIKMTKNGIRRFVFGIDIPLVAERENGWVIIGTCMVTKVISELAGGKKGSISTVAIAEITRIYSAEESRVVTNAFPWTKPENRIGK